MRNSIVYLVVIPDCYYYGDRHVDAIFEKEEDANGYIAKKGKREGYYEIDDQEINPEF